MDRRTRRTRQSIFEAFNILLSEMPYDKISIRHITEQADVGRSTFYAHFKTKDDLMRQMCADLFEHIFSTELNKEDSHDFSGKDTSLENHLVHILYHLKDNQRHIRGILSGNESRYLFRSYLKGYLIEMASQKQSPTFINLPEDYVQEILSSSFIETVNWWFGQDFTPSPEEMIAYYMTLINL